MIKHWSPFLLSMVCASVAFAEPPGASRADVQKTAAALVKKKLIEPIKKAESHRSRFSRGAPVAVERRVRVLDAQLLTDAHGRGFVRFAIDVRFPGEWITDAAIGCAYLADGTVFVRLQGQNDYRPAAALLGDDVKAPPEVCRSASAAAQVASAMR